MSTKMIARCGVLAAISALLVYLFHFPLLPQVPFLEYDPADIPIYFSTLMFGAVDGLIITIIASVIQGITVSAGSGFIGILMHIFATGTFVIVLGATSKRFSKIVSIIFAIFSMTIIMIIWNLILTPLFLGSSVQAVIPLLPFIIAFNILKGAINGFIAFGLTFIKVPKQ
jgi:riboflavin transporter FmnP